MEKIIKVSLNLELEGKKGLSEFVTEVINKVISHEIKGDVSDQIITTVFEKFKDKIK